MPHSMPHPRRSCSLRHPSLTRAPTSTRAALLLPQDGDDITIDAEKRVMDLHISEEEMQVRAAVLAKGGRARVRRQRRLLRMLLPAPHAHASRMLGGGGPTYGCATQQGSKKNSSRCPFSQTGG